MVNRTDEGESILRKRPWIVALVFLFSCFTDTVLFGTNQNTGFTGFQRFFIIILAILMTFLTSSKHAIGKTKQRNYYAVSCFVFVFFTVIIIGRLFNGYYYYTVVCCILIAIAFSKLCTLEEFAQYFIKVMLLISVYSLVVFIFQDFIVRLSFIPKIRNTTNYTYYFVGLSNIPGSYNHRIRNEGPYWEAGTYQAYLNMALLFTLFYDRSKRKMIRALIFIITALTTVSGAVLIPMILIISAYLFNNENEAHSSNKWKVVVVVLLLATIAAVYSTGFLDEMMIKLTNGTDNSSFAYRYSSAISDFRSFLKNPLFGTSPEVLDERRNQVGALYGVRKVGVTNTFAGWFALFGFSIGVLMLLNYWRLSKRIASTRLSSLFLFSAFIALTSNENLTASPLFFVMPFLLTNEEYKNAYVGSIRRIVFKMHGVIR